MRGKADTCQSGETWRARVRTPAKLIFPLWSRLISHSNGALVARVTRPAPFKMKFPARIAPGFHKTIGRAAPHLHVTNFPHFYSSPSKNFLNILISCRVFETRFSVPFNRSASIIAQARSISYFQILVGTGFTKKQKLLS